MINKFTTPRQPAQLNETNTLDNEHHMELTSDELSKLHGGWSGVASGIASGILTELIVAGAKATWASRTSYADTVGTFDYPGA